MVATLLRCCNTQCRLWTFNECSTSSLPTSLSPPSHNKHDRPFCSSPSTDRGVPPGTPSPTPGIQPSSPSTTRRCTPQHPHPTRHMDTQRHTPGHQYSPRSNIVPHYPTNTMVQKIQPVLDIFPWQLSRFGLQDHSLRTLSQGRYTSQLLPEMRAHNLDIDNIAEYLHQQANQSIPNKTTDAKQFMQLLISRLIDFLRGLTPPAGEGTALRKLQQQIDRLHQQESELQRARDKLKTHGIALTPTKPGNHHQLPNPNPISHLQPQQHSQPTPFLTPQLKPYTTTHQPTMRQQAFRNGSRHYHQPHRHKSPISSKFFETNVSQKNSSRKQPHATASRSAGYLSYHPVRYSSWWPRARHWRPDSLNKRCVNQHISLYNS